MTRLASTVAARAIGTWLAASVFSLTALSATFTVEYGNYYYYPVSLTVKVGDTVNFAETFGGTHTVTGTDRLEPMCGGEATTGCSITFTTTGAFPYKCLYHASQYSMTGMVLVVAASNSPPSVSIARPTNGTVLAAPATATVLANATDRDGPIARVQFNLNGVSAGAVQKSPYSIILSNLQAGSYSLAAVATDNGGASATSGAVHFSVVTPAPVLLSAPVLSNGVVQFGYSADIGLTYVIQASSNLSSWLALATNTAGAGNLLYVEPPEPRANRFYRVRVQ